jgi:hypothetical protein
MNQVGRILNQLSIEGHGMSAKRILNDQSLSLLLNTFYENLMSRVMANGKKKADERKLKMTITSLFCDIDKQLFAIINPDERNEKTGLTIIIVTAICQEFIQNYGVTVQKQLDCVLSVYLVEHNASKESFRCRLVAGIREKYVFSQPDIKEFCKTYYDCSLNDKAMNELILFCRRKKLLYGKADFYDLCGKHDCNIEIWWNMDYLKELVYFFDRLRIMGIMKIRGNKGYWKGLQDHLCDSKGNPYQGTLCDVFEELAANSVFYSRRMKKVEVLIDLVLKAQNS